MTCQKVSSRGWWKPAARRFKTSWTLSSLGLLIALCVVLSDIPAGAVELGVQELPLSPFVGPHQQPLAFYQQIPIATLTARPADYSLRYVRLKGTVSAVETTVRPNACVGPSELTFITLEDESGRLVVIDAGRCAPRNLSPVRAPSLATGQQVDMLVFIAETPQSGVEALVTWIELVRE